MLTNSPTKYKFILSLIILTVIFALCDVGYLFWHNHTTQAKKLQQAVTLTAEQAENISNLQNQLHINKQNAGMVAEKLKQAQTGEIKYIEKFIVQADNIQQATKQIAERINASDPALPPVALKKSDRTVIVPNANKTPVSDYDVGIFKINLDKPRGLGVYASTESVGAVITYKNVSVFGGKKYHDGNELGVMYQARW